jgi:hypothetical protein
MYQKDHSPWERWPIQCIHIQINAKTIKKERKGKHYYTKTHHYKEVRWKDILCLCIGIINIVKISTIPRSKDSVKFHSKFQHHLSEK